MKSDKRSLIGRLALEMLIVFLGVYLAFLFNAHGERTKTKTRQAQLLRGLYTEIDFFLAGALRRSPLMNDAFAAWNQNLAAGTYQTPPYFVMKGDDLPTSSMWQVVMYFDGIQLLDVPIMFELSKYYNSFDIMLSKYLKLIDFAEAEIIPYADTPSKFYKTDGALTSKYAAYTDRYADFLSLFQNMIEQSRTVKVVLKDEMATQGMDIMQAE